MPSERFHSAAAARNRDAIRDVVVPLLRGRNRVLEVASGSGEHITYIAAALPAVQFQPSDPDPAARGSIAAWVAQSALPNINLPIMLDVCGDWSADKVDAVMCINMVHIAPWAATLALMGGAARSLCPSGILYLYGPYRRGGQHTAPTNLEFDRGLRARNPEWGVRDMERVTEAAAEAGLSLLSVSPMPANNFSLVFSRSD